MKHLPALSLALSLLAAPALAACPPWDGQPERFATLLEEVKAAENPAAGQALSNAMWQIWAKAPDEQAQEMLARGQSARESYEYDKAIAFFGKALAPG